MTLEIPEINFETVTLDELKSHAMLCANAENNLRAYTLSVQFRIIQLIEDEHNSMRLSIRTKPPTAIVKSRRIKPSRFSNAASEDDDDSFTIDDFK